jgi:hypothetical protein
MPSATRATTNGRRPGGRPDRRPASVCRHMARGWCHRPSPAYRFVPAWRMLTTRHHRLLSVPSDRFLLPADIGTIPAVFRSNAYVDYICGKSGRKSPALLFRQALNPGPRLPVSRRGSRRIPEVRPRKGPHHTVKVLKI